jgi:hypothetical protein
LGYEVKNPVIYSPLTPVFAILELPSLECATSLPDSDPFNIRLSPDYLLKLVDNFGVADFPYKE